VEATPLREDVTMTNIRATAAALALTIWMIMGADGLAEPAADVRQEVWGLSLPIPMPAYVAKPAGEGPFPLVVMNHGESLDATARGFFPRAEFRDAALWFARQGYLVVAPVRPGFRTSSIDFPERGLYGIYFGEIGECAEANFRDPGLAIASIDEWTIDYLVRQHVARPKAIVIGQSGGGWGAVALSSRNPQNVRAIIAFAAGRGGHIDGKPNNNRAPEKLIDTAREFGKSARTPVLWIYARNDSYFGPELSKQMFEAFRSAGGVGEYHLVPDFANDGHFLVDSADAIPIWSPIVSSFLELHQ
jgi:dienelactone hydrolase